MPQADGQDNRPARLCFVSLQARAAFVPQAGRPIGGAEVQVSRLAKFAAAQDGAWRVAVIVAANAAHDGGEGESDKASSGAGDAIETVDGVELWPLAQPPRGDGMLAKMRRMAGSALNLDARLREADADAYVLMAAGPEAGIMARVAHAMGRPFVYLVASDKECDVKNPWNDGPSGWLWRRGACQADLVIAQHDSQLPGLELLLGIKARVLPSVYAFGPEPDWAAERRGAIWVGRCVAIKQPLLMVELARRLPDLPCTMLAVPSEREPELYGQVEAAAKDAPNLTLVPGVAADRVGDYYKRHGVLVSTSSFEGLPNAFMEAADHGLAIASLAVDPDGMFSGQGLGRLAGGDMGRLAGAVRELDENQAARRAEAARLRESFCARHDLTRVGPQFLELIRETIDRRRSQTE